MTQELATPADDSPATKKFSLDQFAMLWHEYRMRKARIKADEEWCDTFTSNLKDMCGDASEFTFQGSKVANLVPGQLNVSKLEAEQPELHQQYTRLVSKHQFDRGSFERAEPEMFEKYRTRRFCVTGE